MIERKNYEKMEKLGLIEVVHDLADSEFDSYARLKSEGYMDLIVEALGKKNGIVTASLSHHYQQNGDSVPDPDMVVRIHDDAKLVEVLSYQDSFGIRQVYHVMESGTMIDATAKRELNSFLGKWLTNLKQQGFKLAGVE